MKIQPALLAFAMLVVARPASASGISSPLTSAPPSSVWLNGDSTLHPYGATATVVEIKASFESNGKKTQAFPVLEGSTLATLSFRAPVTTLTSGEKGLDKNMHKALKSWANPSIQFQATSKVLLEPRSGSYHASVPGRLTVAGVSKDVVIEADFTAAKDSVLVTGHHNLLMSDYGIRPPTMMGVIKTRDAVTVGFNLVLVSPPASGAQ